MDIKKQKEFGTIHDFWDESHELLRNQSRARAKVYAGLKYEFCERGEGDFVLAAVLKSIGISLHPATGMEMPEKRTSKKCNGTHEGNPCRSKDCWLRKENLEMAEPVTAALNEVASASPEMPAPVLAAPSSDTVIVTPCKGDNDHENKAARENTENYPPDITRKGKPDSRGGQPISNDTTDRFWPKVDKSAGPDDCWLWTASTTNEGYGQFKYCETMVGAHRVSYQLVHGELENSLDVLHTCDVRACVNPQHLYLGTDEDNVRDRVDRGRGASGEKNGRAKLTDRQVVEIRASVGVTQEALAKTYGVSFSQISAIRRGVRWAQVPVCAQPSFPNAGPWTAGPVFPEETLSGAGRTVNSDEASPKGDVTEERSNCPENAIPAAQNISENSGSGFMKPEYIPPPVASPEPPLTLLPPDEGFTNPPKGTSHCDCVWASDAVYPACPHDHRGHPGESGPVGITSPNTGPVGTQDEAKAPETHERAHARLSPSTLRGKAICSGFVSDPDGDKSFAERGTLGHKAVESENLALCGDDKDLVAAVQKCINYEKALLARLFKPGKPVEVLKEIKVHYYDQFGYFDELIIQGTEAHLLDWKFAVYWYSANSPQFWAYCVGVWNAYPQVEQITVHVAHPFLNTVDTEVFNRKEHYDLFLGNISAIMVKSEANRPEDYRITYQCRFCGFAKNCAKLAKLGIEIGQRYADDLSLTIPEGSLHGSDIADPQVFAALLRLSPILEKAAEGWRKAALALHDAGTDIPGFKLITKKGNRKVASANIAFEVVKKNFIPSLTHEKFLEICTVSATQLDDTVKAITPDGGKKHAADLLGALLEDEDAMTLTSSSSYLMEIKVKK